MKLNGRQSRRSLRSGQAGNTRTVAILNQKGEPAKQLWRLTSPTLYSLAEARYSWSMQTLRVVRGIGARQVRAESVRSWAWTARPSPATFRRFPKL